MSDFTVLVQGPYEPEMLSKNLKHYQEIGDVVVSTYTSPTPFSPANNVRYVLNPPPSKPHFKHSVNLFNQAYTCYAGGKVVDTDFVIKVRSDESWGNLWPMVEALEHSPYKYISCNIFFNKDLYHPSDHCYGMSTENFVDMHKIVLDTCYEAAAWEYVHLNSEHFDLDWNRPLITETVFGVAFMLNSGHMPDDNTNLRNSHMKQFFECIDINKLGPYLWRWNSCPAGYPQEHTDDRYLYPPFNHCIRSIEEL